MFIYSVVSPKGLGKKSSGANCGNGELRNWLDLSSPALLLLSPRSSRRCPPSLPYSSPFRPSYDYPLVRGCQYVRHLHFWSYSLMLILLCDVCLWLVDVHQRITLCRTRRKSRSFWLVFWRRCYSLLLSLGESLSGLLLWGNTSCGLLCLLWGAWWWAVDGVAVLAVLDDRAFASTK